MLKFILDQQIDIGMFLLWWTVVNDVTIKFLLFSDITYEVGRVFYGPFMSFWSIWTSYWLPIEIILRLSQPPQKLVIQSDKLLWWFRIFRQVQSLPEKKGFWKNGWTESISSTIGIYILFFTMFPQLEIFVVKVLITYATLFNSLWY